MTYFKELLLTISWNIELRKGVGMIYFKAILLGFLANLKYRLYYSAIGDYPSYWKTPMITRVQGIAHNIKRGRGYRWDAWIWWG